MSRSTIAVPLMALLLGGCASNRGLLGSGGNVRSDPARAAALARQAADLFESNPADAEKKLREALGADPYCGPAHNNMGVLYVQQEKLYEAANEFESARKLMPGQPDPRMNLGLTFELAGRVDDAIATYHTALEVSPDHVPTMQALARLELRTNRTDEKTRPMLQELCLRGETPQWRDWARERLVTMSN